jgi:hypothetical protein
MSHETCNPVSSVLSYNTVLLLCDPFQHRAFFEDECRQGYAGQIGARSQLADDMCKHCDSMSNWSLVYA